MKTVEEVRNEYIDMFGGYPAFLLMGADEQEEIKLLEECIESGKELEPEEDADY